MHTGKYLWNEDDTIVEMKSDENDTTVDIDDNQYEVEADHNHNYVDILEFGLEDTSYPSSTNEWEGFVGEIDFDDIKASTPHAKNRKGISTERLIKVWHIYLESDQKTLNMTTQIGLSTDNHKLTRNFGTFDRMLIYKRISNFFFMDNLFVTKKSGKSSRGHTCCQIFVTDKDFVYVVPMKLKGEVLQAV